MNAFKNESGQVLVLTALSVTLLMGFMGLAADVGTLFHAKRNLQSAVDDAAVAGALAYKYDTQSGNTSNMNTDIQNAAKAAAVKNGVSNLTVTGTFPTSVTTPTLYVASPPTDGPNAGTASLVEAILTVPQPVFFMAIFGTPNMNVTTRAVAGPGAPSTGCNYNMNKTGTGMYMGGKFNAYEPTCGVIVDSSDSCAMQFNGGSGSLVTAWVSVVGGACKQTSDSSPTPVTNSVYIPDPLYSATNFPDITKACTSTVSSTTISSSTAYTYTPPTTNQVVCFTNTVTISGPAMSSTAPYCSSYLTLSSALYVFEGGVKFGGGCIQTDQTNGATFDLAGSWIQSSSSSTVNPGTYSIAVTTNTYFQLAPMSSSVSCSTCTNGSYGNQNLLIMQPPSNMAAININQGTAFGIIDGTIYAPTSEIILNDQGAQSNSGMTLTLNGDLIDGSLNVQASNITINPPIPSQTPPALKTVTLVE